MKKAVGLEITSFEPSPEVEVIKESITFLAVVIAGIMLSVIILV